MTGRDLRRAGMRGTLAGALAAIVAAALSRSRGRRVGPVAAAAAAAVGASLELRVAAPAFVVGAAAVASSKVRSQGPAAVALASGIGVATGVATTRVWPVAPRREERVAAPARGRMRFPDGDGVAVVVNAAAGSGAAAELLDAISAQLPQATVVEVDEGDDVHSVVDKAAGQARAIAVAGGDGSVAAGVSVALDRDLPLAVLPAGTLNHFARDLGIEKVDDAIGAIRDGALADVDVGTIGDRVFVNTASIGAYSELVDARERLESRIGKWPALLVALVRVLRGSAPCTVEIDGRVRSVWLVFVGNCRYHPHGFAPSWRARLDDGQLDVRIVDAHPWSRTRLVAALLTGTLGRCRVYEERLAASLTIRSLDGPLRLAADGETFDGPEEVRIGKDDRRLSAIVPTR